MTPNNSEVMLYFDSLLNDELQTAVNNADEILVNVNESEPITLNSTDESEPMTSTSTNESEPIIYSTNESELIILNNIDESQPIRSNNTDQSEPIDSNNRDESEPMTLNNTNESEPIISNNRDESELTTSNDAIEVSSKNTIESKPITLDNTGDNLANIPSVEEPQTLKSNNSDKILSDVSTTKYGNGYSGTSKNTDVTVNLSPETSNNIANGSLTNGQLKTPNDTKITKTRNGRFGGKFKKHFQLSTFNEEDLVLKNARESDMQRMVSWGWPYVFTIVGVVTYYLIKMNYDLLPTPVTELQIKENPGLFSGQRSAAILKNITALGERVVGCETNEVSTPALIMNVLEDIRLNKHPSQSIHFEIQTGNGAFNLNSSKTFTSVYRGIHNVVAKLGGTNINRSMLINCHFDSVPSSLGASDDATSCAVMLEILRALSSSGRRLRNDIIFLFNGAEEPFLCGSHLFLQHRWSEHLHAFLNMEGMGGGGKPFLFQASPHAEWLFNYYGNNAPYPHSQVFADEIFESGVIPSDTDYTVFQDFKNIAGLDFAFIRNGYIHHSKYDTEEYVSSASHQVYGENIMETIKAYGNAVNIINKDLYETMVFYDYLGWFMIFYTQYTGTFINLFISLATFVSVATFSYRSFTIKEIIFSALATLCGIVLGVCLSALVGLLMDAVSPLAMTFFSNSFLILPLYWFPCIIGSCLPLYFMDLITFFRLKKPKKHGFNITRQAQMNLVSYQIPWALLLFILTAMGIRSAQILTMTLICTSSVNFIIHLRQPLHNTRYVWLWLYLVTNIFAILYQLYISMLAYIILVPMMGRSGPVNADLIIAVMSAILALLVTSSILPLMTLVRGRLYFLCVLCLATIIAILFATFTQLGMPYHSGPSNPTPQRFFIMHTERSYFTEDNIIRKNVSGYVVLNIDRNTLRTLPEHLTANMTSLQDEAEDEMHSNFITRLSTYGSAATWIPALKDTPHPQLPETLSLNVEQKTCNMENCTLQMDIRGADRMTMFFTPKPGLLLTAWNIPAEMISYDTWEGRPTYFVFIIMGQPATYSLELNFNITVDAVTETDNLVDVGLAGYATHHPELRSEEFKSFIADLPEYSTVTGWNCIYHQYVV